MLGVINIIIIIINTMNAIRKEKVQKASRVRMISICLILQAIKIYKERIIFIERIFTAIC